MVVNYPKNFLLGDLLSAEATGVLANAAPLTEGLVNALGRLAVSDALSEVPPKEPPALATHEVTDLSRISLGKPLQLIKDHFYYLACCPVTGNILEAIEEDAAGTGAPLTGEWHVACADCDRVHAIEISMMKPERLMAPAHNMDGI